MCLSQVNIHKHASVNCIIRTKIRFQPRNGNKGGADPCVRLKQSRLNLYIQKYGDPPSYSCG